MKAFLKYHIIDRGVLLKKKIQLKLFKKNKPILVHTMAKVGSLSVYNSLKNAMPRTAIFHTHNLDFEKENRYIDHCFQNNIYPSSRSSVPLIQNKIISVGRPYKIITLYRDPIERNISAFFDAFNLYVGIEPERYQGNLSELEDLFHKHIPHSYPLNWFDEFLRPETSIDVYKHDFNVDLGHLRIKYENCELLILKSSLPNNLKEELIGIFCNLSGFKLIDSNVTSETNYGELYSKFKDHIKFNDDYLQHQYNSRYAEHYFSKTEKQIAIDKWRKF